MTQTFTPASDLTAEITPNPPLEELRAVPSTQTIQNILNYSRNLEIRPSAMVQELVYLKS